MKQLSLLRCQTNTHVLKSLLLFYSRNLIYKLLFHLLVVFTAAAVRGWEKYFLGLQFLYLVVWVQSIWEKTDVSQKWLDFSHLIHSRIGSFLKR